MKITFLGTNGWYSSPTGDTACILIETEDRYLIFDAGNGLYKIDQCITKPKPISLFISHFHLDHVSGLHVLPKFDFKQGIDVYVGDGRADDFRQLVRPPYTIGFQPGISNIVNLKTPIRLHEFNTTKLHTIKASAIKQHHAYIDHGFRLQIDDKIVAYTGDCGYTNAAIRLAQNADILICECSNKKTDAPDIWGHFDPSSAAALATKAEVEQLILTHFGANLYTTLADRKAAEKMAQTIFPNTLAATDGLAITL